MNTKKQIFISYSWQDRAIVDELDNQFLSIGIYLIRDVREISYKESIYNFMKKIRKSDFVIMIISDAYLKSLNCMNEVIEFIKDEDFKDRILHVFPYNDSRKADIFNPFGRVNYIDYWETKYKQFYQRIESIDEVNKGNTIEDLRKYMTIASSINDFVSMISEMLYVPYDVLVNSNYKILLEKIGIKNPLLISELLLIDTLNSYDEKLIKIDSLIYENPKNYLVFLYKGLLNYKNEFYKQAISNFKKSIEINPANPIAYTYIGGALDELKEYNEAVTYYNESFRLNPNMIKTLVWHGITLDNLGKYKEALELYSKAISMNPLSIEELGIDKELSIYKDLQIENDIYYYHRGLAFFNSNQYELAVSDYNKAIKFNQNDGDYYLNRGLAYYYIGQYELAIADYDKAIDINQNDGDYYYNRGLAYYDIGQYELAQADYTKAIETYTDKETDYYSRGYCYYKCGNFEKAENEWRKSIKSFPKELSTYTSLMELYIITNRIELTFDLIINLNDSDAPQEDRLHYYFILNIIQIISMKEDAGIQHEYFNLLNSIKSTDYDLNELESFIITINEIEVKEKLTKILNTFKKKQKTPLPNKV